MRFYAMKNLRTGKTLIPVVMTTFVAFIITATTASSFAQGLSPGTNSNAEQEQSDPTSNAGDSTSAPIPDQKTLPNESEPEIFNSGEIPSDLAKKTENEQKLIDLYNGDHVFDEKRRAPTVAGTD